MLGAKKLDHLKMCRTRVKAAQNYRDTEGLDDLWDKLKDMYSGKHFPAGLNDEDRIAVNLSFSTINIIGPSVSTNHPKITVNANKPEDEDRAVIIETVLNYWWRTTDIKQEFSLSVQDFLIFGFGWLKTGYRFVQEEKKREDAEIQQDQQDMQAQHDQAAMQNPDMAGDMPTNSEIAANIPDVEMETVEDSVFVDHVSVHDIYVDPLATKLDTARWIAQRIIKDISEVRKNKSYKPSRKNVKSDVETAHNYWPSGDTAKKRNPDAQQIIVWEYYDLRDGSMCVFTEQGDDFLVDPVEQPYAFGHPFVMLRNYEVPDTFYPMGELEAIEGLQQELNKTRSQIMNDRKRYRRKYLYDRKAFSPDAIGALESTKDNSFVAVNEGVDIKEAVMPMQVTPIDAQIYKQTDQIVADINMVTGVNEYEQGGGGQTINRSATEASMIQDAANSRAQFKLARVESFVTQVARRLVMLAQEYMTEPQVIRVVGAQHGPPLWVHVSNHMLQGEYDFDVEAGSTKPLNEGARRDQAMQMIQVLGPLAGSGQIDPTQLLTYVLKNGFGIQNPGKWLGPALQQQPPLGAPQPQPDPNQPPPPNPPNVTINFKDITDPSAQAQILAEAGVKVGGGPLPPSQDPNSPAPNGPPPDAQPQGPPPGGPGMASPVAGGPGGPSQPSPPTDAHGQSTGIPPQIAAQLQGQVGLQPPPPPQ